jgi:UDPglucose--hexose-1-phosphate uridylyltransferase
MNNPGQIRRDRVTGEWTIYSGARAKRPHELKTQSGPSRDLPEIEADCPFCPGNEGQLGEILFESSADNAQGWLTRVVENKFPALTLRGSAERSNLGLRVSMDGYGSHEVIIDSPRHDRDLSSMGKQEIYAVLKTYHRRYLAHANAGQGTTTIIFRNHGPQAGTSLIHPHSQIVTTPVVPAMIRIREAEAQRYWDRMGKCVYCDILAEELEQGTRVLGQGKHFVAFVPYAARVPMEMRLMPRRHAADFGHVTEEELQDLALLLSDVMGRLHTLMKDPDYNLVINTASRHLLEAPYTHWHLSVRPRLSTMAGFEIGSGMNINPSLPEDDAKFLNQDDCGKPAG